MSLSLQFETNFKEQELTTGGLEWVKYKQLLSQFL